ncbi:hypothetical protein Glove_123g14 [Diversispora epigaea]|uniref:Uncharacterized protein n=1 Tax=Diversispora epigaea TaxID=1348612 RepID=A0A397J5A4_9GLOM|nr:hypothetical protein Glove_123g14 [Diversispora epigaea]
MDNTLLLEIDNLKNSLNTLVSDHSKQSQIIKSYNNRIFELESERENYITQINRLHSKLESIIVKFIETLTDNDQDDQKEQQSKKTKIFKRAVAIDAIYGSRHNNSHITSGGSYTKFINWLEGLTKESQPIPEGFLILAFDNEQKGQKNYLDCEFNTVVFHTVTKTNINQLFNLTTNMKNILEKELINYIDEIIDELIIEKQKEKNEIDKLVLSQSGSMGKMKKCISYGKTEIENKKKNCPECNSKLPSLNSINQISSISPELTEPKEKELKIRSHIFQKTNYQPKTRISITQKSLADKNVEIPTLYIPDPIPINPNSISNIKKVLEHIYEITVAVVCDGVPYNLIQKIKKEFPWLILIPGALHEEMNMIIDIKEFAQIQGYRTDNQLAFFKKCTDHHKSWNSICNIYRHAMATELIWPFVQNSIINFRNGIQNNNPLLQNAARRQFSPIWSARRHHIYRLIEITYEEQMQRLKPQIRNIIEKYHVISRSGYKNQHQGLDAILEEINKTLKSLVPPVPSQHHWEIAARNCMNFMKLRETLFKNIGYINKESSGIRTKPDFAIESQRFRVQLRKFDFLNPIQKENIFKSLGNIILKTIPISAEEALSQKNENNMTKEQLIVVINSLLVSFSESQNVRYNNLNNKLKQLC